MVQEREKRFGDTAYLHEWKAPGFSSFVLYLPHAQTTVVIMSNIYSSATTTIGYDVLLSSPRSPLRTVHVRVHRPSAPELKTCTDISVWAGFLPGKRESSLDRKRPGVVHALAVGRRFSADHWIGIASSIVLLGRSQIERGASGRTYCARLRSVSRNGVQST